MSLDLEDEQGMYELVGEFTSLLLGFWADWVRRYFLEGRLILKGVRMPAKEQQKA